MKIILASGSPRRRELIAQAGIDAVIIPAKGKEKAKAKVPEDYVAELACHKALEIFSGIEGESPDDICVIGADTVVVHDGIILGKPKNREDACRMIRDIQGREHEVMTGVCLLYRKEGRKGSIIFTEKTKVSVCPMTEEEIASYVATGEADDKAGAYGIQGRFGIYIAKIDGDYYNVVGLPISRLYHSMKDAGILSKR